MTGGFPAEYGNRFGGVIDIVTRSGLRMENRGAVDGQCRRCRTPARGRRSRRPPRAVRLFPVRVRCSNPIVFSARPIAKAFMTTARGAHLFTQFEGSIGRAGIDQGRRHGRRHEFRDSKDRTSTSCSGRWRRRGRTHGSRRRSSAGRGSCTTWPSPLRPTSDGRGRVSFPPRVRSPCGRRARARSSTLGGKIDATRFSGRHALKAGVDAVRLRPQENLAYNYEGYLEFTHLVGLPHIACGRSVHRLRVAPNQAARSARTCRTACRPAAG